MKYLDNVGDIGNPYRDDKRQSVSLGVARVRAISGRDTLSIEGHDDAGKLWRVLLPQIGGVGWTEVWTADFDANGRRDLLFASLFPGNGRCVDAVRITVLLLDDQNRPVPWQMDTMLPDHGAYPQVPVIVRDLNEDRRAEFVITDCHRVDPPEGFGEQRQVSGVYEARNARMIPLRDADKRPYAQIAGRIHGIPQMQVESTASWADPHAGIDSGPLMRLTRIGTRQAGCGGIRLEMDEGALVPDNACAAIPGDHTVYSDGAVLSCWPTVVIDGSEGREILLTNSWWGLRRVLVAEYPLRRLGTDSLEIMLWAEAQRATAPAKLVSKLTTTPPVREKVHVHLAAAATAAEYDVFLIRGGSCLTLNIRSQPATAFGCDATQLERLRILGIRDGFIRAGDESRIWQFLPGEHRIKFFRTDDLGANGEVTLEPPAKSAVLVNAVELAEGFLAQWRENGHRRLTYHDNEGALLAPELHTEITGDLLTASDYDGVYFVRWLGNDPVEVIQVKAAVEWSIP